MGTRRSRKGPPPGGTDEGLVDFNPGGQVPDSMRALLYDFDINSPTLKQEHEKWLIRAADFMAADAAARARGIPGTSVLGLPEPVWTVRMDGYATNTGNFASNAEKHAYNYELSQEREQAVESFLRGALKERRIPEDFIRYDQQFHGIKNDREVVAGENPRGRSVYVVVSRPLLPPPPPIELPKTVLGSKDFQIRLLSLSDESFLLKGDNPFPVDYATTKATFEILEVSTKRTAKFVFTGKGVHVPLPDSKHSMVTKAATFSFFQTTLPVVFEDFEGAAHFVRAAVGWDNKPKAFLELSGLELLKKNARIVPEKIPIDTGILADPTILQPSEGTMKLQH